APGGAGWRAGGGGGGAARGAGGWRRAFWWRALRWSAWPTAATATRPRRRRAGARRAPAAPDAPHAQASAAASSCRSSAAARCWWTCTCSAVATSCSAQLAVAVALETQGKGGAGLGRAPGVLEQGARKRLVVQQRVAPLVERDPLRQQLGAHAVCLAGDRVQPQAMAHRAAAYLRRMGKDLRGRRAAKLVARAGGGKGSSAEEAHVAQGP